MIRPITFVTMLLAAGSGLYLYQAKQQARVLDRQIHDIRADTEATQQRAEVLRAEYTRLNDPTRLAELVSAHLSDLKPTQPAQWSSMAELDKRLPPEGDATARPAPLEPAAPEAAQGEPAPVATAAPGVVAPAHPAALAHAPAPHPIIALAPDPAPARMPRSPVRVAAAPPPAAAPGRPAPRAPASAVPTMPVLATLRPLPRVVPVSAPAEPRAPMVASALGMARTMLSPVAVTPADAATLSPEPGGGAR